MNSQPIKFATLVGFSAIMMWGTMPTFATLLGKVPPFFINSAAFSVAFLVTLIKWTFVGKSNLAQNCKDNFRLPPKIWALGIFGMFGFHTFYFLAYRHAEPLAVVIIVNLWPLLTVVFSSFFLGYILKSNHLMGGLLGFSGVAFISMRNGFSGSGITALQIQGYMEALICALSWSIFSVFSRKWATEMKPDSVGVFCGVTAALSIICHLLFEQFPVLSTTQLLLIVSMGLFPMGIAFFTWDFGMKHGNVRTLGLLSYCGPLVGITLLITLGLAAYSNEVIIAAGLIVAGALLGTFDFSKLRVKTA